MSQTATPAPRWAQALRCSSSWGWCQACSDVAGASGKQDEGTFLMSNNFSALFLAMVDYNRREEVRMLSLG